MKELLPEQQEFMKALAGETSKIQGPMLPEIDLIGDLDELYFKNKELLREGGYLDIENVKGFDLSKPFSAKNDKEHLYKQYNLWRWG